MGRASAYDKYRDDIVSMIKDGKGRKEIFEALIPEDSLYSFEGFDNYIQRNQLHKHKPVNNLECSKCEYYKELRRPSAHSGKIFYCAKYNYEVRPGVNRLRQCKLYLEEGNDV